MAYFLLFDNRYRDDFVMISLRALECGDALQIELFPPECSLAIRIFFERQHRLYQLGTICVSLERRVYGELGVGAIIFGADQTPLYSCQGHFIKA